MKLCDMKAPATSEGMTGASRPDNPHDESSPCGLCLGPGSVYPLVFALLSTSSSQEFKLYMSVIQRFLWPARHQTSLFARRFIRTPTTS